uniref:Rho guanine nucleotide exchange factor (GEF) 11 n=1 Tax=Cyprinus carpio TaxID=7962 RepID=A0A8C2C400_CYPCA
PGQQRETLSDLPSDNAGTGLVQRCVVVQRDNLGFGFTVCGERIKLVQNVRPGGAAVKAGVQEGDRIIKVNGSLVSSMSHQEVVKMIKCESGCCMFSFLVVVRSVCTDVCSSALTAGTTAPGEAPPPPPTPPTGSSTPTQRITGPKPLQDPEVQKHATEILRKMLEQEEAELQVSVMQDQSVNRSETSPIHLSNGLLCLCAQAFESPFSSPSTFPRNPLLRRQGSDTHPSDSVRRSVDPSSARQCSVLGLQSECLVSRQGGKSQIIGPEEEEEDDGYSINEMDGPFQDIELLKSRPAHMTVFMRYVFSQLLDPNPLVSPAFSYDIGSRLHAQEDIRGPLSELQQQVLPDIQEQLLDYRSKQTMGLGSLFGESDLQQLDGDPVKERQVVDKQVLALWDILSKHEEDRSSPLASAVHLYLRHSGIKLRDSKVFPGLMSEKEKWLPFFPKAKKLSSARRERDGDDKKRNPILKYIGKPRSTSQSTFHVPLSPAEVRPGSVRNIIQQFENNSDSVEEGDTEGQQLSSSSFGEDSMDRSLENPTPPYTPLSARASHSLLSVCRMVDAPVALLPDAPALDEDVIDSQNWQETVEPQVLASLSSREVDRQAVIYELFTTEASHLRTLRVLDQVFYQKMQSVLSPEELSCIFLNLRHVYELHASLCEAMKKRRESPVVQGIGDIMLARFEEQVSHLCSQQSQALELIKSKQRKDPRFAHLIQECEASPHCRRLQLKDLLVAEMQRLTKYPLLLDNIIKHTESENTLQAQARCRGILQAVNEVVRETEHRHRLGQYQRRLDLTPLERLANPVAAQFKNLDLTTKRMIHEGPLTWRVSKDKALLLSDLLVLLQRGADERLVLRCPSRSLGGAPDLKIPFCPILRLDSALVRLVATDNKALYVISTSESQIYELVAGTSSEKNTWKDLLEKTISAATQGAGSSKQGSPAPYVTPSVFVIFESMTSFPPCLSDVSESSVSLERDSASDDETALTPTDGSDTCRHQDRVGYPRTKAAVAEAALQDGEPLCSLASLLFCFMQGFCRSLKSIAKSYI